MKPRRCIFLAGVVLFAASIPLSFAAPLTTTADVAFKVGDNASIDWFEIANPSVGGTITIASQPYSGSDNLNSAVVDASRNRLIYIDDSNLSSPAYAISLTNLQLVPNKATPAQASSIGDWPGGNDNAGYSKANGQVYYHVYGSDQVRTLNFEPDGMINGFTIVGTLNGSSFTTPSVTAGDIDFDSSGTLWISGVNSGGGNRLWSFNPTTLTVMRNVDPVHACSGIAFDAAGTTLYGFDGLTGKYGIVDETTGNFKTVLETSTTLFGGSGDLAEGMETIVVPEPSSLGIILTTIAALHVCRRKGMRLSMGCQRL